MLEKFYVPVWGESGQHYMPRFFQPAFEISVPQALSKKHFLKTKPAKERGGVGAGRTKSLWCMAQTAALSSEQGRTPLAAALATGWGPGLAALFPCAQVTAAF